MREEKILLGGTAALLLGGAFLFSGVVASGIVTGTLGSIGTSFLFLKVKRSYPKIWSLILRYHFLSDLVISGVLIVLLASNTAVGVIGGSVASILTSMGLYWYVNKSRQVHT